MWMKRIIKGEVVEVRKTRRNKRRIFYSLKRGKYTYCDLLLVVCEDTREGLVVKI